MQYPTWMRAAALALALTASGCGGALATPPGSDGGSPHPASTATGSGTTETVGTTGTETGMNTANCLISASNYDQSCTFDGDCTIVATGNFCAADAFECDESINAAATTQYQADAFMTPLGSGALGVGFGCTASVPPCCRRGQCTTQCVSASDTLPTCANMGGNCVYVPPNGLVPCQVTFIPASTSACAYADEVCCVAVPL